MLWQCHAWSSDISSSADLPTSQKCCTRPSNPPAFRQLSLRSLISSFIVTCSWNCSFWKSATIYCVNKFVADHMCAVLFLKLFFQWLAYLAGQFMFLIWMQWEEEEETKTDTPKAYWLKLQQFLWPFTATMEKDGFCHILWYLHFSNTKTGPGKTHENYDPLWKKEQSLQAVWL